MTRPAISLFRQQALRNALQASVDLLYHRRASEIPDGYIDDYVSLGWLEWRGGALALTPTGETSISVQRRSSMQLPPQERAELARQGAKAAARGDLVSSNPMRRPQNAPVATGESQALWTERRDAWLVGHEQQSAAARHGDVRWSGDRDDELD